ncbi:D-2-hydroxyacid dehydrogenase family protein [Microvirga antarctica]|uniref:D-2-hydroxyacid dehydrogenase family protein n=1 Tax=Microvirga antarctica TaxID=2819233 RepID=UPI001B30FF1F|nr:D-2-hydroxyacid dehydrogenase family protein [Microvirga antarctica]
MRIAFLDDYQHQSQKVLDWSKLPSSCTVHVFDKPLGDEHEAAEKLQPFEIVSLVRERMPFRASLIAKLPNLKLIAITGMYNRTLDVAAATERGILVSHTRLRGTYHRATSELAWGLILAVARHIPLEAQNMRSGGWQTSVGVTLAGRTLGLLGLGRQARNMVPVARAFGMDVIAWSENLTPEAAHEAGARWVSKDELFKASDVLSVHLVLGDRSRHLVGARQLDLMKRTAILINTARGPIVEEAALIRALKDGWIAGAGLDVFDQEPLPVSHPLRELPNAVLSPHLGYNVEEFFQVAYEDTFENIAAFVTGNPIRLLGADRNFSSPPR